MENPQSRQVLARHGKSFYWASFFLSNDVFNKCSSLYNFCRTLDDIVDDDNKLEVKKEIFSKFKKDFENKDSDNQIINDMWSIIDSENISKKIVIDLFDGVETDLEEKVQMKSKKDLLIYSYRVAGTVGLMMSKILKVKNKEALKGAIDLGIAMQLTNIARDVIDKGWRDEENSNTYTNNRIDKSLNHREDNNDFYNETNDYQQSWIFEKNEKWVNPFNNKQEISIDNSSNGDDEIIVTDSVAFIAGS